MKDPLDQAESFLLFQLKKMNRYIFFQNDRSINSDTVPDIPNEVQRPGAEWKVKK
jgi:hypothetical protein